REDCYLWRILATGASFSLFGLGALVLGYLVFPLVTLFARDRQTATRRCRYLVHLCFRAFVRFMRSTGVLSWSVEGRERLALPGQLVIANHPSLIDIVFLIAMLPNASCIVKADLYRNPFTRGPVSRAGYVPNNSPEQLLDDCVRTLAAGTSLVIFPEGTRSVRGGELRFRRGAAYVWLQANCPLALATISSDPPTLGKGEKWYQIPHRRPHFRLAVKRDIREARKTPEAPSARELTRYWQHYFRQEIST
ncbi:MAG: lysophospholipid acyltransferase family protein, partial [Parahaliea sp.]